MHAPFTARHDDDGLRGGAAKRGGNLRLHGELLRAARDANERGTAAHLGVARVGLERSTGEGDDAEDGDG